MNFENLNADVNKILTKHFTKGRGGNKIQFVVTHYNYGDLTVEGCYSVWQTREASAHYQVESSGRIGQLVWDGDTAWHAGNWAANQKSIGIEHANQGNSMTDACIENGAHLCAAICKYYGLGRPEWMVNVFPHCHFSSTSCPGPLKEGTSYHDKYMKRAQYWYDVMTGTQTERAGWVNQDDKWWYRHSDGSYTTNGWEPIDGKWYHFDSEGWMQTGWILDNDKWYYLTDSGAMATGWVSVDGKWYYLDDSGAMATGWIDVDGNRYYLNDSGAMATGWLMYEGSWYYLNDSGAMVKDSTINVNGENYVIDKDGKMITGDLELYATESGQLKVRKKPEA